MPLEWTGHHQPSSLPQALCLPLRGSVRYQCNRANKRRSGGKEVRNSDLLMNRDADIGGEIDMAVGGEELDEDHK